MLLMSLNIRSSYMNHIISQFLHVSFVSLRSPKVSIVSLRTCPPTPRPRGPWRGRGPFPEDEPEPAAEEFLDAEPMAGRLRTGFAEGFAGGVQVGMPLR